MAYKTLESWIGDQLSAKDQEPGRKLRAIQLRINMPGGGTGEVVTLPIEGKTWTSTQVYNTLKGRAENEIKDKPGRHVFECLAFYDKDESASEHTTFVCEDGEVKPMGSRGHSEGANLQGVVGQLMRHTENAMQAMKTMAEGIAIRAIQREDKLHEREEYLQNEVNAAYGIVREITFKQTAGEHEMAMTRLKFERDTANQTAMFQQAPHLINALAGAEVIPTEASDTAMLDEIGNSIDPDKIDVLVQIGMIQPKQAQVLKLRFQQARAKRAKELEEMKKVPEGATGNVENVIPMLGRKKEPSGSGPDGGASAGA
jgi:hypothetical protein